jgi:hypothetical protein
MPTAIRTKPTPTQRHGEAVARTLPPAVNRPMIRAKPPSAKKAEGRDPDGVLDQVPDASERGPGRSHGQAEPPRCSRPVCAEGPKQCQRHGCADKGCAEEQYGQVVTYRLRVVRIHISKSDRPVRERQPPAASAAYTHARMEPFSVNKDGRSNSPRPTENVLRAGKHAEQIGRRAKVLADGLVTLFGSGAT